jgi:hypothetical protein
MRVTKGVMQLLTNGMVEKESIEKSETESWNIWNGTLPSQAR